MCVGVSLIFMPVVFCGCTYARFSVWLALCCQILSDFVFSFSFLLHLERTKKINLGKLGMVVLFFYEKWNGGRGGAPVDKKNKSMEEKHFLGAGCSRLFV